MPDLSFRIESVEAIPFAAVPMLGFGLRVENADPEERIQAVVLRVQIQIESTRRRYSAEDQERASDLFGAPDRWTKTLRTMLWTHANAVVRPFTGSASMRLDVPCSFDFNVGATKYFEAVRDGEIPLQFLFSGTAFYVNEEGALQVAPISWEKECRFRLPVEVWREMMAHYYPNTAWLCLRRDVFDRLDQYKRAQSLTSWEQALEAML